MIEWFVGAAAIGVMVVLPWGVGHCASYRELPGNKLPINNWLMGAWILSALALCLVVPWMIGGIVLTLMGRPSG